MQSSLVRLQNIFGLFTSAAFIVAAFIAASDFAAPRTPSASVSLKDIQTIYGRPHYYSTRKEQYAVIHFALSVDLSSLFTWNTKQVFVYVSASWPNSTSEVDSNEAVIWDNIITNPSADHLLNVGPATKKKLIAKSKGRPIDPRRGKFELKRQRAKYHITSPTRNIAELDNVVLKFHYNVQPWVGILTWTPKIEFWRWKKLKGGESSIFRFPPAKV